MDVEAQLRVLLQQGKINEAVVLCQRVLAAQPENFPALDFMARLCVQKGDRANALVFVRRILNSPADINRVMYLKLTGELCGKLKDWQGSLDAYREVLELVPDELEARVNVASLQLRLGQYEEARESATRVFEQIQSTEPSALPKSALGICIYRVADLFKGSRAREVLETVLPLKDAVECGFLEQDFNYWYGLGVLHDALGEYEPSLAAFRKANALRREQAPFDVTATVAQIRQMVSVFDKHYFDSVASEQNADDVVPIFIVGMPRTGSTLVEQILGRHSAVAPLGELDAMNRSLGEVLAAGGQGRWNFNEPGSLDEEFFQRFREAYLSRCRRGNARYFTDKMPWNLMYVWLAAGAFPNARVIYTQRDKLATVMSCFTTNFGDELRFTESMEDSVRMHELFEEVASNWAPLLGERMRVQLYEDLVSEPEQDIPRLLDFVGLEFEPECLEPHKSQRTVTTASMFQITQPIYRHGNERWLPYLEFLGGGRSLFEQAK